MSHTQILAHRGNSGEAPENTLAAFRAVAETGCDGVEFDVQLSADGEPVVIHDEYLHRTTDGTGTVGEHTLAALRRLDAGRWFGPDFAGEHIPTLAEVLAVFRGTGLAVNVELKTNRAPYPGLGAIVAREVAAQDMAGQVTVSSFNPDSLKEVRHAAPHLPRAALSHTASAAPWHEATEQGLSAWHLNLLAVTDGLAADFRTAGLPLRVFTVNNAADAEHLFALGVDAIITNHPRMMVALRDEWATRRAAPALPAAGRAVPETAW